MTRQAIFCAVLCGLMAAHVSTATRADNREPAAPPTGWQSTLLTNHPLAGTIWSTAENRAITASELGTALSKPRFVLLGEVHDNADHHRFQAWGIATISKLRGARIAEGASQIGAIALEMLSNDDALKLDKFYDRDGKARRPRTVRDFGRILEWEKSGWPSFEIYAPIVEQALYAELALVPASPSAEETKSLSKGGLAALGDERARNLKLDAPLNQDLSDALNSELAESHCGMLPATALPKMSLVQRFRDATMADALLAAGENRGGILIAGNGHVRRDRGVPHALMARGVPATDIVTVIHLEVEAGETEAAAYVPKSPDGRPAVEFVWLTAKHERADPCEEMRKQMGAPAPG